MLRQGLEVSAFKAATANVREAGFWRGVGGCNSTGVASPVFLLPSWELQGRGRRERKVEVLGDQDLLDC